MMKHLILSFCAVIAACCSAGNIQAQNCSDSEACNYNPAFEGGVLNAPCLIVETVVEHTEGDLAGMTTYRVFFQAEMPTDFVTSVYGNLGTPLTLTTTTTFYQNQLGSASSQSQNPLLFEGFPNLIYDSYVTIGLSETANASAGESNPSLVPSPNQDWISAFDPGGGAAGTVGLFRVELPYIFENNPIRSRSGRSPLISIFKKVQKCLQLKLKER